MENLKSIVLGYQELFYKTGKVEFFMMYRRLQRLDKIISASDNNVSKLYEQINNDNNEENLTI